MDDLFDPFGYAIADDAGMAVTPGASVEAGAFENPPSSGSTFRVAARSSGNCASTVPELVSAPVALPESEWVASGAEDKRVEESLASLSVALDRLASVGFDVLSTTARLETSRKLANVENRVAALRSTVLACIERGGDLEGQGARTLPELERQHSGNSIGTSRKNIARAKALDEDLPKFKQAFLDGEITQEHVDVIREITRDPQVKEKLADPDAGEASLVEIAKIADAGEFRKRARVWKTKHRPRVAEREHARELRQETLTLFQDSSGWVLKGWFTALNGEMLNQALEAMMGVPTKGDPRLPNERRAGALTELVSSRLDHGDLLSSSRVRPHISVHVPLETIVAATSAGRAGDGNTGDANSADASDADGSNADGASGGGNIADGATGSSDVGDPICILVGDSLARELRDMRGTGRLKRSSATATATSTTGSSASASSAIPVSGGDGRQRQNLVNSSGGEISCPVHGLQGECVQKLADLREQVGSAISQIRTRSNPDLFTGMEPATLDDGTPLVPSQLDTLLCDSFVRRVVFGPDGEPLDIGRKDRLCNANQVRAVIARDRTCRFPGCSHTVTASKIHHAQHWENGGPSDIDNLVMLCWHHHQHVHRQNIDVYHHAGGWVFADSSGIIGVTMHESARSRAGNRQMASAN